MWDSVNEDCEVCGCSCVSSNGVYKLPNHFCANYSRTELEKENIQQNLGSSPLKHESDLSLYGNPSPQRLNCHASSPHCTRQRRPLEDHDANSQDSGYGASFPGEGEKFYRIARSLGVTPRQDLSPRKNYALSFDSMDMDDEFLEITDLEQQSSTSPLPTDFNCLISENFAANTSTKIVSPGSSLSVRPPLRRSVSLSAANDTPNSSRVRSCLFKNDDELRSFKRPDPPVEANSPVRLKRSRILEDNDDDEELSLAAVPVSSKPLLRRCVSATEESIKNALYRSTTEPDLIGDFSTSYSLPLIIGGRHQDLKSITSPTIVSLMKREFNETVASYQIIDCRYPYEYEAGHIRGAVNLYSKEQILEQLLNKSMPPKTHNPTKRHVLIFHCEFSSERGPNSYRFLRNLDRICNKDVYPSLHYPEIYLLEGGYKYFYEHYPKLCDPEGYKPMLHPDHQEELRHFRLKGKLWHSDRDRSTSKGSLKRLGFV